MSEYTFNNDKDSQSGIVAISFVFVLLTAFFAFVFISSLVSGSLLSIMNYSTLGIFFMTIVCPIAFARCLYRYALSRKYRAHIGDTGFSLIYGLSKHRENLVRYSEISRIIIINENSVFGRTKNIILFRFGFNSSLFLSNFSNKDKAVFDEMINELEKRSGKKPHEVRKFGQMVELIVLMLWK
ncbi:MAG: hypothetical protein WC509_05965 [Candidatus Izemoplasmatales bacterium]